MIKFIRFNLVGILNTIIDFTVFAILTKVFGVSIIISQIIAYSCGLTNSFLLNKKFTFKSKETVSIALIGRFLLVNMVALLFSLGYLGVLAKYFKEGILFLKLSSIAFTMIINYVGNAYFTFKNQEDEKRISIEFKYILFFMLFVFFVLFGIMILYCGGMIGVADNSDFNRVVQPVGIEYSHTLKYFYFQKIHPYITEHDSLFEHVKFILFPPVENLARYHTTQFLFIKIAQVVNGVFYAMKDGLVSFFNIGFLGLIYLIIYALSSALLMTSVINKEKKIQSIFLGALFLLMFYGDGYLTYFNSFFGEAMSLACFMAYMATVMYILEKEKTDIWVLLLNNLAAILFVGAKVSNIPLGMLMIVFSIFLLFENRNWLKRGLIVLGCMLILLTSAYYYVKVPKWMEYVNSYHALFFGVLKYPYMEDDQTVIDDLNYFGIEDEYATLQGTHGYMDHKGYDIYSDEFNEEVYLKTGPLKIGLYYVTHPKRLYEKMQLSAKACSVIRSPYLGNYNNEDNSEIVKFSNRFSFYESFLKRFRVLLFYIYSGIILAMLLYCIMYFIRFKKTKVYFDFLRALFRFVFVGFALSQWVLAFIGNGEADLIKHMFMFHLIIDMGIWLVVFDTMKTKKKNIILICLMVSILFGVFLTSKKPKETMMFGGYKNEPISWEIVDENSKSLTLISKEPIMNLAFDKEDHRYIESDILEYLNDPNGFLEVFDDKEEKRLITTKKDVILSPIYSKYAKKGEEGLFWYCILDDITQNSYKAWSEPVLAKVHLLGVEEYENYSFTKVKDSMYWLSTPYSFKDTVRVVGKDGFVYHKRVNNDDIAVVVKIVISKD